MAQATDRQWATWFRPGSSSLSMRVSDAERAQVADRLARHYGDGRLDRAEFDERVSRAMAAKTVADLQGLFDDLPDAPSDSVPGSAPGSAPGSGQAPWAPPAPGSRGAVRRRGSRGLVRLALTLILVVVAANITANVTWHALTFWFTPVTWLAILAVIVLVLMRRSHSSGR